MNPTGEADPDEFEIQITDNEFEPAINSIGNKPQQNHVDKGHEPDLLRASLSDVILNQSLQFSGRSIDFENGGTVDTRANDEYQHMLHNIAADERQGLADREQEADIVLTFPDNEPLSTQKRSDKTAGDTAADFEDEVDPALLTSTLRASKEDSDDEFDFDLPTSKVDKGKNVRFSGECDFPEQKIEETKLNEDAKGDDKLKENEQFTVAAPSAPSATVGDRGDVKPVMTEVKMEIAPLSADEVESDQDPEKEDRSHIITSSAADWDNVETVEAGFTDAQTAEGVELMSSVPPLLSFSDVWQHFRTMDHTPVKDKIQVTVEKRGVAGIISRLFGPPKMHKDLHADRELVFCIAATAFDNREEQHLQSLQTIYRVLTGSRFSCPRYGSHWEEIGFQGRDPATDLRGTGMLALVQLVSFLQEDSTAQLARDLYKLSLHPTQNFPFCVMCINISRISLQALREGLLNRECNTQKTVMPVVNQFYAGTLLHLYRVWQQGKTISDSGFVIREVETRAKKQSKEVFKDLQAYINSHKAGAEGRSAGSATSKGSGKKEDDIKFFSVVKSDTKTAAELY